MITNLGRQQKKRRPTIRTRRKMHTAVPPEFSAQSQHSDGRVTVPVRIGLQAYALARSAPKGNAQLKDHAPLSAVRHSL